MEVMRENVSLAGECEEALKAGEEEVESHL